MSQDPKSGFAYLRNIIRWQNRPDGGYVALVPGAFPDENELMIGLVTAGILNAPATTIAKLARDKVEGWQRVGKRFELRETADQSPIRVRVEEARAVMILEQNRMDEQGRCVEVDELVELLASSGVKSGVLRETLQSIIDGQLGPGWHTVATGQDPIHGTDSILECLVDYSANNIPIPGEDGSVDLHERGRLPEVMEGTLLYRRIPGVVARDGFDLQGRKLEARRGAEVTLAPSTFTRLNAQDPNLLEAACDGYLFRARDGLLQVGSVFEVKGDLDLAVGNIKYHGPVEVRGKVPAGFLIEAKGNILIHGTAEAAHIISTHGAIEIRGGLFGGTIRGEKGVRVAFAHDATLETPALLDGGKYLQHCTVRCHTLKCGMFVGGEALVYHEMICDVMGTEAGSPTRVRMADPHEDDALADLEKVLAEEKKITPLREILEHKVIQVKQRISKGALLGAARADAEDTLKQYSALMEKIRQIEQRKADAQAVLALEREHNGSIAVRRDVHTGVEMHIFGKRVESGELHPPVRVSLNQDQEIETSRI